MTLVVDASIAVKWVVDEDDSQSALALRGRDRLIAPSLIHAEIGNALWKAVNKRGVSATDAAAAFSAIIAGLDTIVPIDEISARAFDIAITLKHPIYDCYYLALAERESAPLVTADQRLLKAAKRLKGIQAQSI